MRLTFPNKARLPILAILLLGTTTTLLQAHLRLLTPPARTVDYGFTTPPCGTTQTGQPVATLVAGTEVELLIDVSVDHVNQLQAEISFDDAANFDVLASRPTAGAGLYKLNVTLPDGPAGAAVLRATDGEYVSCADVTLADSAPFHITTGLTDAWYDPATNGQGFFIVVFPEIEWIFLSWFTFDSERPPEDVQTVFGEAGHRWLTASGPYQDNFAELDIVMTQGGVLDSPEPPPQNSENGTVGTLLMTFEDCETGTVEYDMPTLAFSGTVTIQRVVDENVARCQAISSP